MAGNRYDRGWMGGRGYGREFGARRTPPPRRGYDAGMRGGYDREWSDEVAFGREPGMPGPMFTPFGWDPMMRWSGWDPLMGFVPYQDAPREWSYGLEGDYARYDHEFYRGNVAHRYGGDYRYGRDYRGGGYDRGYRASPRRGPLYGRGYDAERIIRPRRGPR